MASKKRNSSAKIADKKRQKQDAIKRERKNLEKRIEEYHEAQRNHNISRFAKSAKENNLVMDSVTQQIMSPKDAIIAGLANENAKNRGQVITSTSSLLSSPYDKKQ